MKKLLALILCVMMFVAVIPTSAFAATTVKANYPTIDNPLMSVAQYTKEIKNMIGNTKTAVQTAYGVLVGDKVVYSAAKGMDDTIVGLVDAISKDLIEKNVTITYSNGTKVTINKPYVDGIKDQVRLLMDGLVAKAMADNEYKYASYKADGSVDKIDPLKYAQVFSKAVSDALTNKNFQKGYEAVATYFALGNMIVDVNDQIKKEYDAFKDSVDMTFDKNFQDKYPELWKEYIDTLSDVGHYKIDDPWAELYKVAAPDPFTDAHKDAATTPGTDETVTIGKLDVSTGTSENTAG